MFMFAAPQQQAERKKEAVTFKRSTDNVRSAECQDMRDLLALISRARSRLDLEAALACVVLWLQVAAMPRTALQLGQEQLFVQARMAGCSHNRSI